MMAATALGMLALFLLVLTVSTLKSYRFIGSGVAATNTIQVSGEGEVFAVPDTATFSYSVQDTEKDVQSAQNVVSQKGNSIIAYLKAQGIADADIQTTDYSVDPQYVYPSTVCPPGGGGTSIYCPPGRQTLTGYQASETVTVKVRDASKAGALLSGVGGKGATDVSSLTFTVADEKAVEAQARGKAIADAQSKAQALAQQLGVSLVRIVGFSENGNYPVPYAYDKTMALGASAQSAPVAPTIATGQNKITSDVSLTYEIQ